MASTVAADPLVVGREEPHERDQQEGGVEVVGLVVLAEDAAGRDALVQHLRLDLVGRPPATASARSSSPRSSARRMPRSTATQHITLDAVNCLGLAPDLPDPLVGVVAVVDGLVHEGGHPLPRRLGHLHLRAPDLVSIASSSSPQTSSCCWSKAPLPTRTGRDPRQPDRWSSVCSVRSLLAADAVHDLEGERRRRRLGARAVQHRLQDEGEEVDRLPLEAQPVERPQDERRVADPGVAVVPVPLAARGLGERGGGRGHDGPGRGVAEPLQREGAALDVLAPAVVGHLGRAQPVAPALLRRLHRLGGLGHGGRAAWRPTTAPRRPTRPRPAWPGPGSAGPTTPSRMLLVKAERQVAVLGADGQRGRSRRPRTPWCCPTRP